MRKQILLVFFVFSVSLFALTEIKSSDIQRKNKKQIYDNEIMDGDYLIEQNISIKYDYSPDILKKLEDELKEVEKNNEKISDILERYNKISEK